MSRPCVFTIMVVYTTIERGSQILARGGELCPNTYFERRHSKSLLQYLLAARSSRPSMDDPNLDEIDHAILHALQEDARHNSNAAISERVGVSASTVGKRIDRLEENGVIQGYRPEIDYEQAGFPLLVLFICTAPITEREPLIDRTLDLEGVVNVRELMTGERNVHILVTGAANDDITRIAHEIDEMGYTVTDEILMRDEYTQPSVHFAPSNE